MRTKFLLTAAKLVTKYPKWVLSIAAVLTAASVLLATTCLQMNTDQDDLVSEKLGYHKRYKDYLREFGDLEYLYVVVETGAHGGAPLQNAKEFIRALAGRLENIPGIREVTYQISNPKLEKSFLLYLPAQQLKAIGEFLPKMASIRSIADVFGMMNGEIGKLPLTPALSSATTTSADRHEGRGSMKTGFRFLDKLLDGMAASAKDGKPYTPFLQQAFFGGDRAYDEDGFLLSDTGKLLFIMIMPEKNYKTLAVIDEPLKKIRTALDETKREFPDVSAGLTGRPVLSADEMSVSNTDMTIATIAALLIVTLIFVAYFRRLTRPLMAAASLGFGIAQTFGLASVVIGHLNILSIVFAVILVGAGIEFGLQIVSRYREELASHKNVRLAIETCITHTGKGNVTAALTTSAAFFAACFTNFLALKELGFIAGSGILLCLLNMFFTLPAMLFLRDRGKHPDRLHTVLKIKLDRFKYFYDHPRVVVGIAGVVTIALIPALFNIKFNHNLLDLQARGLESVKYEKKIIEESSQSTWYLPFVSSSREVSLDLAEKLRAFPNIGRVETVADAVPEGQDEKIKIIHVIASPKGAAISNKQFREIASSAFGGLAMTQELQKFQENIVHLTELAFSAGEIASVDELEKIGSKVELILGAIEGGDGTPLLQSFEKEFISDMSHHIELLKSGLHPENVTLADMPQSIQRRYVSEISGRYQLYAYPKYDVWQPSLMAEFIKDARSLDSNVTGTPVEVYESSKLLERSFKQAAIFSMLAIIAIVFADFRNFKKSLLALAPLFLGMLWLFELMGLFGIRFNLANFFGIPILLGIGVDNAVQVVHRFKASGSSAEMVAGIMTRSTGVAVLLTSITTFASFVTLVFARHQGIASLGIIMSLGTVTCFVGSMIILPCLLKLRYLN